MHMQTIPNVAFDFGHFLKLCMLCVKCCHISDEAQSGGRPWIRH